jgi:hypothetical protein
MLTLTEATQLPLPRNAAIPAGQRILPGVGTDVDAPTNV